MREGVNTMSKKLSFLPLVLAVQCLMALQSTETIAAEKPNFVWLISEDNSKHFLKLFDEHGAPTPRISQMAEHGLIFENAFSNAPVCSVARTTLITGCYAPRIGTQFHRRSVTVPMPDGLKMFPAYLREAGYYTANNSKKDYNAVEGKGVWDESSKKASWRKRKQDQPFFYKQSFTTSHESSLHFSEQVMQNEKTKTEPASVFIAPYHPDTPTFRYTYAHYHDRIQMIDSQIGEVVDQLEKDGLLEDTFVFYFGDHGGVLPRGKGYAYESGLHVPLVIRVPKNFQHLVNIDNGTRIPGFVSFIDFGPTLLNLAGLTVPEQVDGVPFLGKNLTLDEINQRDEAFGYADRFDEKYDLVRTLRVGNFEYVRSYQPFNFDGLQNNYRYRMLAYQEWRKLFHEGKLNTAQKQFFEPRPAEALYDISKDPHEVNNLADDPEHKKVLSEMRKRLAKKVQSLPDLSFFPESYLVENAFNTPVTYGKNHRKEIKKLVVIADLSLLPFEKAKVKIENALYSSDPWHRYWGLIVCSSFGESASSFIDRAKMLAKEDLEPLVRVRAAEFLGLIGAEDPRPTIMSVLKHVESGPEANLILNTATLLNDGKPGYKFSISPDDLTPTARKFGDAKRRLEYFELKQ